jgi:hypothetical protein
MLGVKIQKSNIIGSQPSVEEGIAEMPNIHMCLTSRICEQAGCWPTGYFMAISKHLLTVGFPPQQK